MDFDPLSLSKFNDSRLFSEWISWLSWLNRDGGTSLFLHLQVFGRNETKCAHVILLASKDPCSFNVTSFLW